MLCQKPLFLFSLMVWGGGGVRVLSTSISLKQTEKWNTLFGVKMFDSDLTTELPSRMNNKISWRSYILNKK